MNNDKRECMPAQASNQAVPEEELLDILRRITLEYPEPTWLFSRCLLFDYSGIRHLSRDEPDRVVMAMR